MPQLSESGRGIFRVRSAGWFRANQCAGRLLRLVRGGSRDRQREGKREDGPVTWRAAFDHEAAPWPSASCRLMYSPSPVPGTLRKAGSVGPMEALENPLVVRPRECQHRYRRPRTNARSRSLENDDRQLGRTEVVRERVVDQVVQDPTQLLRVCLHWNWITRQGRGNLAA